MEEENERRKEAEDMILLLENEEKELIERLKRSQDLQQKVKLFNIVNSLFFVILIDVQAYSILQKSLES